MASTRQFTSSLARTYLVVASTYTPDRLGSIHHRSFDVEGEGADVRVDVDAHSALRDVVGERRRALGTKHGEHTGSWWTIVLFVEYVRMFCCVLVLVKESWSR